MSDDAEAIPRRAEKEFNRNQQFQIERQRELKEQRAREAGGS